MRAVVRVLAFGSTLFGLVLAACSGSDRVELGGFTVERTPTGDLLTLSSAAGPLLQTTSGRSFAVRGGAATFEEKFGAFQLVDHPTGEWRYGATIGAFDAQGDGFAADVADASGLSLGSLSVTVVQDNLHILFLPSDPASNRSRAGLRCDPPQAGGYLGFGAQTKDVDQRGQTVPIWVSEQGIGKTDDDAVPALWPLVGSLHQSYAPIPGFLAPRAGQSYGLLSTTDHHSIWDICQSDPSELAVTVWQGRLELVLSPGPTPLEVIAQQTALSGRAPLGPDWTFGVWMERVGGTAAVREELNLLRAAHIPFSAMWSEDWRGGGAAGAANYLLEEDWRLDTALYPDFGELVSELHRRGSKFMAYFNTFVVDSADIAAEAQGFLIKDHQGVPISFDGPSFKPTGLIDLYSAEARRFVKGELGRALELGIDGWMADYAEWYPADPAAITAPTGLDAEAAHQRYPVAWAEVNREALAEHPQSDAVVFHRSAYLGAQGKIGVMWAGDQRTSFQADDGLPTVVPIMLGLGVSGFPVVTHDIGGYASATNPPCTKDLYFRWTVLGALSPVMRTHHGRAALVNWRWSSDAETTAHFRRWAELHTRWFPLWKGLAKLASESGAPVLRPLAFADPGDLRLHGVRDQYLIGEGILVAPVLTASTSTRSVVLPRGSWFPFEGGTAVEGGGSLTVPVPLSEASIWMRAGTVLPLLPAGVESLVAAEGLTDLGDVRFERELWIWLGGDGEASDGEGARYTLRSPGAPEGPLRAVGEGLVSLEEGPRSLALSLPPSTGTLELVEGSGRTHRLQLEGGHATQPITVRVRW